jgi:uncharacterized delta-60 repeat protein
MATEWNQTTFLSTSGGEVAQFISGAVASGGSGGSSSSSGNTGSITITEDTSIDFGNAFSYPAYSVDHQSNGKLIVGATNNSYDGTNNSTKIFRLATDGTLDTSFGNRGGITYPGVDNMSYPRVKVDPINDKIYVNPRYGKLYETTGTNESQLYYGSPLTRLSYLFRLNSDGSYDTTFNSNVYSTFGGQYSATSYLISDFDLQSDGKIIVTSEKSGSLFRLNQNGTLDNTFRNGPLTGSTQMGDATPPMNTGYPRTVVVLPDDSIVFDIADNTTYETSSLGYSNTFHYTRRPIRKASADGALDTTFNSNQSNYYGPNTRAVRYSHTPHTMFAWNDGTLIMGGIGTQISGSNTSQSLDFSRVFVPEYGIPGYSSYPWSTPSVLTQISQSDATYIPNGSSGFVINDVGLRNAGRSNSWPKGYDDLVTDIERDKVGNHWVAGIFNNWVDKSGNVTETDWYQNHAIPTEQHILRIRPDGNIDMLDSPYLDTDTSTVSWGIITEPISDIALWHDTDDIKVTFVGKFDNVSSAKGGILQFKVANAYGFTHTVGTYNDGRYELSCDKSGSVTEGQTITWTLHTRGVPTGNVAYTISGITSADLSAGSLTGNFNVNYHTYKWGSQVSVTLADDGTYETENITLTLDGTGISQTISITDTTSQPSGGGGGVPGAGVYSNDWMEVSGSTTFNLVSGSEMTYKITLTDNSYWSNTSVDVTSGDFYFRNFNYPVNNATHGATLRATDRGFTEVQFDLDDSYGTITGSHLFFHDGVAEFKAIYKDSTYPAYTASAITNGDYLTYKPGLWRLYKNGTGDITYSPGVGSNDYRNIAHSSSINWTLQDWPSTSTTSSISQRLTLYPNKTIYWVSRSLDDGASGYPNGQTYSSVNTLNTPMKIGDYIYDATGSIRSTYSDFVATHNSGTSSYFDFSDPSPYAPHRHAAISKGQVIKTWYNDGQKQGNWNPVIKSLFTGSYEWTVDSPEYNKVRTFEVQSKEGWWYRFNTRGTTTLRSTVEPTLYLTESGDSGTTFTQGTHYTDDVFGDVSQGWAKEIVSMSVNTNTPPTSATNYSTTREIYYLSSNSKRNFGWTNYISGVSGSLLFYRQSGSYGEQNVIESYTSASDTDYLSYPWRRNGIPSGQSDEGDVNYHEASPDTMQGNRYIHYNGAMYMRTQKGLPYPTTNTQGDATFVWKYDIQSLDNTQGIFYLGTDINGNIISGSNNLNIGGTYNYPTDLSGFAWSSTTKFTCGTGNKWPANGDTIYYYDGPLAGNAFTAPSNGTWYVVFTAEVPTTDLTLHSSTWNRMQINTDGSIGTVLNNIS